MTWECCTSFNLVSDHEKINIILPELKKKFVYNAAETWLYRFFNRMILLLIKCSKSNEKLCKNSNFGAKSQTNWRKMLHRPTLNLWSNRYKYVINITFHNCRIKPPIKFSIYSQFWVINVPASSSIPYAYSINNVINFDWIIFWVRIVIKRPKIFDLITPHPQLSHDSHSSAQQRCTNPHSNFIFDYTVLLIDNFAAFCILQQTNAKW